MSDRTETFEQLLRLEPGRTALLVVDMQRGFLDPGAAMEVPEARAIVPVVADLIARFRASRLPVAFSRVPTVRVGTCPTPSRASPARCSQLAAKTPNEHARVR